MPPGYIFKPPFWFVIDVLSTFPMDKAAEVIVGHGGGGGLEIFGLIRIVRLVRLLKLFRVLKLGKIMSAIEEYVDINPAMLRLGSTIFKITFFSHLLACGYHVRFIEE